MTTRAVLFIDSRVKDYQALTAGLEPHTKWYLLDPDQDGVLQMQQFLSGYRGLNAIHIVSHGSPGALMLGNTRLSADTLEAYTPALRAIGSSLFAGGDLLLYGCDVAKGDEGTSFIQALTAITGADVAGSVNVTGPESLGGDEVLEMHTGTIQARALSLAGLTESLTVNTAPTFVLSDGKLTTDFGGADTARGIALQSDGKIVVGGYSLGTQGRGYDVVISRYEVDGTLDLNFGSEGKVIAHIHNWDLVFDLAVQTDGKIIAGGGVSGHLSLFRYDPNGSPDATFGNNGIEQNLFFAGNSNSSDGYGIALQPDGKTLVVGYTSGGSIALARHNTDGNLDPTFGVNGKVTSTYTGTSVGYDINLLPDNKILVVGSHRNSKGYDDFSITRYTRDGVLDSSFGESGWSFSDFGSAAIARSIAVQPDGKIITAGSTNNKFALARFDIDGNLDESFAGGGKITTNIGSKSMAHSVVVQSDGKIIVAGESDRDFAIARYSSAGALDTSFALDGVLKVDFGSTDSAYRVALQSDGKVLVSGIGSDDFAVIRINSDGSLDTTFSAPEDTLLQSGAARYTEGSSNRILAPTAQIYDHELAFAGHYTGATLTLARFGGPSAQDVFSNTGTLTILNTGDYFTVGSTTIGRVTTNSDGILSLVFNSNATQSLVNSAMQQIAYSNTSDAPPATVQIGWTFNDGNTGVQGTGGALSITGKTTVTITPTNDLPYIAASIPDLTVQADAALNYTIPTGTFIDPDGESLTYTVAMANGTGLPPWLSFNAATRKLSGSPTPGDAGSFEIRINATDSSGAVASDNVNVTVSVNNAPTLKISTLPASTYESEYNDERAYASNFTFSAAGHLSGSNDVDWYAVNLNAPGMQTITVDTSSMSFGMWNVYWYDPNMQVLSGRNIGASIGDATFTYEIPAFVSGTYSVRVQPSNSTFYNGGQYNIYLSAPEQFAYVDTVADDTYANKTGTLIGSDVDAGTTLAYGITGAAGSGATVSKASTYGTLTVNKASGEFVYVPNDAAIERLKTSATDAFTMTVSDGKATTSATYTLRLTGADDPTTFGGTSTGTVSENGTTSFGGTLTVADRDTGDAAIIAQSNSAGTYGKFSIGAGGAWSYVLSNSAANVQALNAGQSVIDTFEVRTAGGVTQSISVTVNGANDTPGLATPSALNFIDTAADDVYMLEFNGALNATDVDTGTVFTYGITGGALIDGMATKTGTFGSLMVNPATGGYTFFPNSGAIQGIKTSSIETFKVSVFDGIASSEANLVVNVTGTNDTPLLAVPIADQSSTVGSTFAFQVPVGSFADRDAGDALTYTAAVDGGSALPSWLSFDPSTRIFGGTPLVGSAGSLNLKVTASDGSGSASGTFLLLVNAAPTANAVTGTAQADELIGTSGWDALAGLGGNDSLDGQAGNDELDGGSGIDVAIYRAARADATFSTTATGYTVTSAADGTDTLANIERLKFADISVALDLAGNAGIVAKILGAVFGPAEVANEVYAGIGLYYIDGGMSYESLMQLAIDARLGPGASHPAIVDLLYTNVVGSPPSPEEAATFVALLDTNAFTVPGLGVYAADFFLNLDNINLIGLASTGLEYVPFFEG